MLNLDRNALLKRLEERSISIDTEGEYPQEILKELGVLGAYRISDHLQNRESLAPLLEFQSRIAEACLNTSFCVWCQTACAWYLLHTPNRKLQEELLDRVERAQVMAGTGLSNPMKASAHIETIRLHALPVQGGYRINGYLPWVSNLNEGSYIGAIMLLPQGQTLAGLIHCDGESVHLNKNQKFIALNGSATVGIRLHNYFLNNNRVLAVDGESFLNQIRPGFILFQTAMIIGNTTTCLAEIQKNMRRKKNLPNKFEIEYKKLLQQLEILKVKTLTISKQLNKTDLKEILHLRLSLAYHNQNVANLLRVMAGASGYMNNTSASRKLRESHFISIVTPSISHLEVVLNDWNG